MEFLIATNNPHKLGEMQRILQQLGHEGISLRQAGLDIEPEEDGETFAQNAAIKAQAVCGAAGRPAIADDSGLVVDALGGAPGVYSARYAGEAQDSAANNLKLLAELEGVEQGQRGARFVCALALAMPGGQMLQTQGVCEGEIAFAPRGEDGFGYDPLFLVAGRSFAEMDAAEKDEISHRGAALREFAAALPGFLEQLCFDTGKY